ncbi:MAG: hypothetical protein ACT4OK_21935 [Gemmobacter sp.]
MPVGATIVGVFTLGLIIGAVAAPWLPGTESGREGRHMTTLIEELEADFGPERVQAAVLRARMRQDAGGHY